MGAEGKKGGEAEERREREELYVEQDHADEEVEWDPKEVEHGRPDVLWDEDTTKVWRVLYSLIV